MNVDWSAVDSTAMGSPVSVTVADLVMEVIEEQALSTFLYSAPRIYKRYVDDTFIVMLHVHIQAFFDHMNSINPHIKFTMELPCDGHLAFLDLDVSVGDAGQFSVDVHRKECHTNQYLNYSSHHPIQQRRGTASTLLRRAWTLPSTIAKCEFEEKKVIKALENNGYPSRLLTKTSRAVRRTIESNTPAQISDTKVRGRVTLPYIAGVTERVARILSSHDIKVAQKPARTLRNMLVHPKNPVPHLDKRGVIYKVQCEDCTCTYVGETARSLGVRLSEHRRALRLNQPDKSAIAEHALKTDHNINWDGVQVVSQEQNWGQRRWKEAIAIHQHQADLNRNDGFCLPSQYYSLF